MASIINVDKVRATGSTTDGILVDSSGRVTTPAQPAFFAYLSADQSITLNSWEKIEFNATDFDTGSDFDSSTNYRFVAPVNGVYQFNSSLNPDYTSGSNTRVFARFYKNGSAYAQFAHETLYANDRGIVSGSITIKLDATDYVEIFIYLEGGTSSVVNGATPSSSNGAPTHFSGFLVG